MCKSEYTTDVSVEISQLLLWTLNDERFSFLTTLVGNNLSNISTRCASPPQGELEHLVETSDKLLPTEVVKKENLSSFHMQLMLTM